MVMSNPYFELDIAGQGGSPLVAPNNAEGSPFRIVRELEKADYLRYTPFLRYNRSEEVGSMQTDAPLVKIRQSHHRVARLIAEGKRLNEVANLTGFASSYISVLQQDPTMKELIAFYESKVQTKFQDLIDKMKDMSADAMAELHERILQNPDMVSTKDLVSLAKMVLDRTGYPAETKNKVDIKAGLDSETIAFLKERAASGNSAFTKVISRLESPKAIIYQNENTEMPIELLEYAEEEEVLID